MKSEIEVKFLDVDFDGIRQRLEAAGAVCEQPMRLMRRVIIETPEMKAKNGYLRVRDEGDKTTVTYKQFDALSVDGAKEIEFVASDFDAAVSLLDASGLRYRSFQESRRETWHMDDCEVVLDEWPWLKPYIEIEGDNEGSLKKSAESLGLDWSNAVFGDVMVAYRAQYPHVGEHDTVGDIAEVRFEAPLPDLFKS